MPGENWTIHFRIKLERKYYTFLEELKVLAQVGLEELISDQEYTVFVQVQRSL